MERTLSKNEAKVILDLEWRGKTTITLTDLREMLDGSENYARYLAHRLVKKGWLERLRPGLFQLVPASRGRDGVADTNPLVAAAVLVSPYFFSFGTACTHHGLTEQRFSEVYIACRERRPAEIIRGIREAGLVALRGILTEEQAEILDALRVLRESTPGGRRHGFHS